MAAAANVSIKLESDDLTTDKLDLTTTLNKTPITMGGILRRMAFRVTGSGTAEEIAEETHFKEGAVVYVYNPGSDTAATGNITLEIGGKDVMVLGAGEWALFPWSAGQSGDDINVTAGTSGNILEYGVFGEPV
jgi:hypothetical protein